MKHTIHLVDVRTSRQIGKQFLADWDLQAGDRIRADNKSWVVVWKVNGTVVLRRLDDGKERPGKGERS